MVERVEVEEGQAEDSIEGKSGRKLDIQEAGKQGNQRKQKEDWKA
jgi:hypothetical protein